MSAQNTQFLVCFIPCNTKDILIPSTTHISKHSSMVHLPGILFCLQRGKSITHFKEWHMLKIIWMQFLIFKMNKNIHSVQFTKQLLSHWSYVTFLPSPPPPPPISSDSASEKNGTVCKEKCYWSGWYFLSSKYRYLPTQYEKEYFWKKKKKSRKKGKSPTLQRFWKWIKYTIL